MDVLVGTAGARTEWEKEQRLDAPDLLRGFALLGILLVNALMFAGPLNGGHLGGIAEQLARGAVTTLAATKFYLLFSFVFGYAFTLQESSAARAGAAFAPRHLRRCLVLFGLGVVHAVVLFPGDILAPYAVLGLLLFAFRGSSPRMLGWTAVGLLGFVAVLMAGYGLLLLGHPPPEGRELADAVPSQSGVLDVPLDHLRALPAQWVANVVFAPSIFAAFLAGLAAGRLRLPTRSVRQRALERRVLRLGLPVGLAGSLFMAVCSHGPLGPEWFWLGTAAGMLTAPALTGAYVVALLRWADGPRGHRLGRALRASGRMSLTLYLTQSLVLALVLTEYGLGLRGDLGVLPLLGGCLALYAGQLVVAAWLAGRVRRAPAEWLLHRSTVGRGA